MELNMYVLVGHFTVGNNLPNHKRRNPSNTMLINPKFATTLHDLRIGM